MKLRAALLRKSLVDVTRRPGRTILAILGICIGVLGITTASQATDLLSTTFFYSTDATVVPDMYFTVEPLPSSVLAQVRRQPNVVRLQARTSALLEWNNTPAYNSSHPTVEITASPDGVESVLWPYQLTSGHLPGPGEIILDGSAQAFNPISLGEQIVMRGPNGRQISLRVVGLARTRGIAVWHTTAWTEGYMSPEGLQQVVQQTGIAAAIPTMPQGTQMLIQTRDPTRVQQTFQELTTILQAAHVKIFAAPYSRFHYSSYNGDLQLPTAGLLLVVRLLTGLSLLLVCVMIFNIVNTLLSEQIKVIGIMKALGGTRRAIIGSYLLSVSLYSLVGSGSGLLLGLVAGYQMASMLAAQIQIGPLQHPLDVGPFQAAPWVILLGMVVGILVPLLSAFIPLWIGTRITVREAIAAYGVSTAGRHTTRAWGQHVPWMPQTAWLGIRGLFRRRGRSSLTLLSLVIAVMVFLAVQLTDDDLHATVIQPSTPFHSDLRVDLTNAGETASTNALLPHLLALSNVERIEPFDPLMISLDRHELQLIGVLSETKLYQPRLVIGRWLLPHEQGALVLNEYAAARLHVRAGDALDVQSEGAEAVKERWHIVGIVHEPFEVSPGANPFGRLGVAFATLDAENNLRHKPADSASRLMVRARDHSSQALQQLRLILQRTMENAGLEQAYVNLFLTQDEQGPDPLLYVYLLFDAVAVLVALVDLLGLTHTISASVLERRLEIGVLRSLGATSWHVSMVFCIEGLALALLAWIPGSLFGLVGGTVMVNILANYFGPIDALFSPVLLLSTLLFSMIVASLASMGPSRLASRMRVRSILRYE